jgi:16S rRNA processing protein RimM
MATGANDVLVVVASDGKERLIPWLPDDIVTRVDLDAREIEVQWDPEF